MNPSIRILSIRIINNIFISDLTLINWSMIDTILKIALNEKQSLKIEISYLLYNFVEKDCLFMIKKAIKHGLIKILFDYTLLFNKLCQRNANDACMSLSKRVREEKKEDTK